MKAFFTTLLARFLIALFILEDLFGWACGRPSVMREQWFEFERMRTRYGHSRPVFYWSVLKVWVSPRDENGG